MGKLFSALSADHTVRIFIAQSTDIAEKARQIHGCSPVVTAALGRLLTAGTIMGRTLKEKNDLLTLQIHGDGPLGTLVVTADHLGNVKGYPGCANVDIPLKSKGKLDVGGAVGNGTLTVIRDNGSNQPYIGKTQLVSGEIAEDITYYFAASEQIPTVCALGVLVDTDQSVKSAGGFLIQLLPGADDTAIERIEQNLKDIPPISSWLLTDSIEQIAEKLMGTLGIYPLETTSIQFHCECSYDRCIKALSTLSPTDIDEMIQKDGGAELSCHFCNSTYRFDSDALRAIIEKK